MMRAFLFAHNDAAPIHRLPTELLSHTFTLCYHNTQSIRIAHVCRRWRDVLFGISTFWVDVLAGQSFNFCHASAQVRQRRMAFMKTLLRLSFVRNITIRLVHYQTTFTQCLEQNPWGVG